VNVAICILAKNERRNIGHCLEQIGRQTLLLRNSLQAHVIIAANGCTDDTAAVAQASERALAARATLLVRNLEEGGKSRTWNKVVHELAPAATDYFIFVDADVELIDDEVMARLLAMLEREPRAAVSSGYPVKDISAKERKSLLDRFSLSISRESRHANALNGSLYVGQAAELREIWLPDETPGEDGFLNAMVTTRGFSSPEDPFRVLTSERPTHYFKAHSAAGFFGHERRMLVGTMINRWIFEHLWSLSFTEPAGQSIRRWNHDDPSWVEKIITDRTAGRRWVIARALVLGRLSRRQQTSAWRYLLQLPIGLAASLLTLPPAIAANRKLKQAGAAKTW
jgi:glycosyltransferase involved in cell wall biosynthesis